MLLNSKNKVLVAIITSVNKESAVVLAIQIYATITMPDVIGSRQNNNIKLEFELA